MARTFLMSLILAGLPILAAAECGHERQASMSCAEGTTWDAEQRLCVPVTG